MIKINLLPIRAAKKKEVVQQQVTILVGVLLAVLVICGAVYGVTYMKISAAKKEIAASEQELNRLKKKIGEIDNIKKLQADVKKKLDVLAQLRKEKKGPASRLAKLSGSAPDKLWLTKYVENGPNVSVSGVAFSEELIAEFMRNLQDSGEFTNVELMVSEQLAKGEVKVKRFDVTYLIKNLKKDEPAKPSKK